MTWDKLVSNANKTKAKARIFKNYHPDQRCPKNRRPLKINNIGQDKWPAHPKLEVSQNLQAKP